MCLYPKLIINRKYKKTKKNGGIIPPVKDQRTLYVPIGCTKCIECKKQKARNWQVRLQEEIKTSKNGKFITLTFSNEKIAELIEQIPAELEGYDIDNAIATLAVRRFLENWRKHNGKSVRHWLITELGHQGTENIHLHGIIWTDDIDEISRRWPYGHVWKGKKLQNGKVQNYVSARTVNYMVKYVMKPDRQHQGYKNKILTSPGIGGNYTKTYDAKLNKFNGDQTEERYRINNGCQIAMPIYYRNKIYNDDEREKLWLIRLDKEERFICGERVSVKDGMQAYERLLEYHRARNKKLGYGDDERTWRQEQYEKAVRNLTILTRIKNAKKPIKPGLPGRSQEDRKTRTSRKRTKKNVEMANTKNEITKGRTNTIRRTQQRQRDNIPLQWQNNTKKPMDQNTLNT